LTVEELADIASGTSLELSAKEVAHADRATMRSLRGSR
jgi:hypothetical protein